MIVSHKFKFIFIKTRKTAGSSIERKLQPYLGPEDILSGSEQDGTPRQNFPLNGKGHIGWKTILDKGYVTPEQWNTYFKFCVERNSYDKAVSDWLYHRDIRGTIGEKMSLQAFVLQRAPTDWERYTEEDKPVVEVVRYEMLHSFFSKFAASILKIPLELDIYIKKNRSRGDSSIYYRKEPLARAAVYSRFRKEISHFHFSPPEIT